MKASRRSIALAVWGIMLWPPPFALPRPDGGGNGLSPRRSGGTIGGLSLLRVVYFRLCQDLVSEVAAQVLGGSEVNLAPFEAENLMADR